MRNAGEKESHTAGGISPTASQDGLKKKKKKIGTRPHADTHPMLSVFTAVNK